MNFKFRQNKILNARDRKQVTVNIPSWYLGRLLRPGHDAYDTYFNPAMNSFYDYSGEIRQLPTFFDYTKRSNLDRTDYKINDSKFASKLHIYDNNKTINSNTLALFLRDNGRVTT